MNCDATSQVRVLVVDDNEGAVTATVKYLQISGYEARGAGNGALALNVAAHWLPDAVILDIGLPDIDGFTVLRQLKEKSAQRAVMFIAVSGRDDDATRARGQREGFDHFLVKPVRLDALIALLPHVRHADPQRTPSNADRSAHGGKHGD